MYHNKVKNGKHCNNYTLQLNLTKLNLDVCKEDIPILGGQNSLMFWLFHSLHAVSQLAWVCTSLQWNWDMRIGWLAVAWFQMGLPIRSNSNLCHYVGLKCWYRLQRQPIFTVIYVIREIDSICWDFTVFKGINFTSLNSI